MWVPGIIVWEWVLAGAIILTTPKSVILAVSEVTFMSMLLAERSRCAVGGVVPWR